MKNIFKLTVLGLILISNNGISVASDDPCCGGGTTGEKPPYSILIDQNLNNI